MNSDEQKKEYGLNTPCNEQSPGGAAAARSSMRELSAPARFEEQQPTMRFATISSPAQQNRTIHFEPPLRRVDPGGLSGLRPLRGRGQPELVKTSAPKTSTPSLRIHGRSKSESALAREWSVDSAALPCRPTDFPPARTSTTRTILGAKADEVSKRLSECLQFRSIKTSFSKSEENLARCRNVSYCKFTIRLYAGEDGGVVVEIQRLCGDGISFMRDCRALLNAAEGKLIRDAAANSRDEKPLHLRLPVSDMSFLKTVSLPPTTREDEVETLNSTADLLSSHRSDSNALGMESLVIQTDPLKTMKSTAVLASRRILCPDEPGNDQFNMHNYVMSLLIYGNEEESVPDADVPEEEDNHAAVEDHTARMRNLAASSVHNALSLLSKEKLLASVVKSDREWYATVLMPRFVRDLGAAAARPHDACYASRCLSILAESLTDFALKIKDVGGHTALEKAEGVGMREFAMLARDARSCHKVLSCCV